MVEVTYQMVLSTIQTAGLLVGIVYYITIMRNSQRNQQLTLKAQEQALETRQAQLFMGIYDQDLQRQNLKAQANCMDMDFSSVEEFEEKHGKANNPEAYYDWLYHQDYMEGIGVLIREGYVSIRLVALLSGGMVKRGWEKFAPVIKEYRVKYDWPRWAIEYEYLYNELMRYAKEHPELQL